MCGLAGSAGPRTVSREVLRGMCREIAHRGPDDDAAHLVEGRVSLGFRRLSVIDLTTGAQPLANEDGRIVATCNGEIYNYRELGGRLRAAGHVLPSASDAAVLPHLLEEHGPDLVTELDGMFALAVWDERRDELLLAVDRLGVKPLYWALAGDTLVWGSEPAAILASGLIDAEPDPEALRDYLVLQYVPAPRTGFLGIHKLEPGHRLRFAGGRVSIDAYWRYPTAVEPQARSFEDALDQADELIRAAVAKRLVSDVPLGAFLSGGIDSSLVVSYMTELLGEVRTYAVDFEEARFAEGVHARRIADLLGTTHEDRVLDAHEVPRIASQVARMGEPFADASAIPTFLLCGFAAEHVTVALSGDGGDEAFGGYLRYAPKYASRALGTAARAVPSAFVPGRFASRHDGARMRPAERYARMMSHFPPSDLRTGMTAGFLARCGAPEDVWEHQLRLPEVTGPVRQRCLLDAQTYLPGDLLPKVDRMSMAHALEVRGPLLDYRLHEFASTLPDDLRWGGAYGSKRLLKGLAERRGIPQDLIMRRKQGFGVPVGEWLRGDLREWSADLLSPDAVRARGVMRPELVADLLDEHLAGRRDRATMLWNLAMLETWFRTCVDGAPRGMAHV